MVVEPRGVREPREELLAACRAGDAEAWSRLFADTRDYVHGVALFVTGDPAAAADATQETYLRLLTRLAQFRGQSKFTTWLYRIAVNAARDQQRRRRPALPLDTAEAALLQEPSPSAEARTLADERSRRLRSAVAALPTRLRLPLVLRYVAGLSYAEIGEVLGLPGGTVASRLSRALLHLEDALGEEAAP